MFTHKSSPLPAKESVDVLVESFNDFFIQKIDLLRHSLLASQDQQTLFHDPGHLSSPTTHSLSDFHRPDVQSIISTVNSLTSKTCQLDPIPTHMVKENLPSLSTIICNIVKSSLSTAQFPDILKLSYIRPCLKKPDLDKELYQSYRHLPTFLSLARLLKIQLRPKSSTTWTPIHFYHLFSQPIDVVTRLKLHCYEYKTIF